MEHSYKKLNNKVLSIIFTAHKNHISMTRLRTLISGILTVTAIITASCYTSCQPDSCSVVCNNGGTCQDNKCVCPSAYTGTYCDQLNLTGSWKGTENLTSSAGYDQTLVIAPGATDSTVSISFLAGHAAGKTINGTMDVSKTIIKFKNQLITTTSTPDTVSGTIQLVSATHITNNYTYSNSQDGLIYNITGYYTKQ